MVPDSQRSEYLHGRGQLLALYIKNKSPLRTVVQHVIVVDSHLQPSIKIREGPDTGNVSEHRMCRLPELAVGFEAVLNLVGRKFIQILTGTYAAASSGKEILLRLYVCIRSVTAVTLCARVALY